MKCEFVQDNPVALSGGTACADIDIYVHLCDPAISSAPKRSRAYVSFRGVIVVHRHRARVVASTAYGLFPHSLAPISTLFSPEFCRREDIWEMNFPNFRTSEQSECCHMTLTKFGRSFNTSFLAARLATWWWCPASGTRMTTRTSPSSPLAHYGSYKPHRHQPRKEYAKHSPLSHAALVSLSTYAAASPVQ